MKFSHNQHFEYRIFDSLIDKNVSFALYRLPGDYTVNFIIQNSPRRHLLRRLSDLNTKKGFVIAPFHISEQSPIILIEPDITLKGEEIIFQFLDTNNIEGSLHNESNDYSPVNSFDTYKDIYTKFHSAVNSNSFEKLVLSRTCNHENDESFSAGVSFDRACDKYPESFVYLCHTPETGTWLGSSPELLISGQGDNWKTVALAGTKNASSTTSEWDEKNRMEQEIVVNYMQLQLQKAKLPFIQSEPTNLQAGNIVHLKTEFSFKIPDLMKIGNLLELLHPSPAVCGFPKEEAFRFILENEGYDRQYYSGFLGCLDVDNKTDMYVNLRCTKVNKKSSLLFAGGGILPSSDLESEWEETENKMQTILSIIEETPLDL